MKKQDLEEIIAEYPTPVYVFDLDALTARAGKIQERLQQEHIKLCYAMKANPFLVKPMEALVERFEVCSPGEFRICEREKLPMERLVISGVNKEPGDILRIVTEYQGQGIFTVESMQQLELLADCAVKTGHKLKVLVRISSGNQFGVEFEQAQKILIEQEKYPGLYFQGIQYYSGTQKKLKVIQKELQQLDQWLMELMEQGVSVPELEYGPGFPVHYFQSEPEEDMEELLETFAGFIREMKFSGEITLEMGRFLVADCGNFLTALVDRKETKGQIYGIVDGGIHHLNYYGQMMAMKLPYVQHISGTREAIDIEGRLRTEDHKSEQTVLEGTEEKWNICGSLCTVADVIVKQLPLTGAKVGDVLVFEKTGAYSVMEGIGLFLSRDLPGVLFYSKEQGVQVVRKSQSTDMLNSRMI